MKQALERLEQGPRKNINPEDEFYQNDLDAYCSSLATEKVKRDNSIGYVCSLCPKQFCTRESFVTHIKNKHQDKIDETYQKKSTKDWVERTFQKEMKRAMKNNYYNDPNKLLN